MSRICSTRPLVGQTLISKPARGSSTVRCQAQLGDKVLPMLRNTTDVLLLGPRLALGALLSTNQNFEKLPADLERLSTIISDPRPMDQKQNEVLLEIEDRVAGFIERGLNAENEVITAVSDIIPEEVKSSLPEELRKAVLTPRPVSSATDAQWGSPAGNGNGTAADFGNDSKPMATWTITSMDEEDQQFPSTASKSSRSSGIDDNEPPASAATVASSQAAAELVEIQSAVLAVREQLSALQSNTDSSKVNMLKLNLKEASQGLSQRLEQRSAGPGVDAAVVAAADEAAALLLEVESLV